MRIFIASLFDNIKNDFYSFIYLLLSTSSVLFLQGETNTKLNLNSKRLKEAMAAMQVNK